MIAITITGLGKNGNGEPLSAVANVFVRGVFSL